MTKTGTSQEPLGDVGVSISLEDAVVFEKLMAPDDKKSKLSEVSGMIAYANYALQKHQYIEQFKKENHDEPPSDDLLKSIILSFKTDGAALDGLRQQSERLLREYAEEYAIAMGSRRIVKPIETAIKTETRSLRASVDERMRFWPGVGASMLGALFYSFLVAVVIFITTVSAPETKFSRAFTILFEEAQVQKGSDEKI